jgi:hypothetical protein
MKNAERFEGLRLSDRRRSHIALLPLKLQEIKLKGAKEKSPG